MAILERLDQLGEFGIEFSRGTEGSLSPRCKAASGGRREDMAGEDKKSHHV
jgi:hypothetical protein